MTDLKQRVIENLLKEDSFDMSYWGNIKYLQEGKTGDGCGTTCCLAGHIVAAAAQLKIDYTLDGIESHYNMVELVARRIWAGQYGGEEANRLEFDLAWGDVTQVTVQNVIDHLNGCDAIYYEEEE